MLGWVLAFAGTSGSASQSCGSTSQSLMRHVLHAGGVSGAADHARQPQFDLPGGRGDNAPWPIWPQPDNSRLEFGPLVLSSSIAASDSWRMCTVSTVSAVSMTSSSTTLTSLGWLLSAHFNIANKSESRTALLASVNLAALPVVRLSTLSLSLASGRSLMTC